MELVGKIIDKLLTIWLFFLGKRKKKAGDAFVDFAEINSIIRNWVHEQPALNIERVLILRAHNGQMGKKLMPIGYKYVSVIANDYKAPFIDVRTLYQALPQDNEYVATIAEVYLKKEIELDPKRMNKGLLRSIYEKEGVGLAKMFFLAHNEEELWFMTIATSKPTETFDSIDHRTTVFFGVNRIRDIIKPYFK